MILSERTPLSPAAAVALAFLASGLINAVSWLPSFELPRVWGEQLTRQPEAPWLVRLEAGAFDAAHFLLAGLLATGLAALWQVLARSRPDSRWRAPLGVLGVYVVGLGVGAALLPVDLTNFSQRQTFVSPSMALASGVFIIGATLPVGVVVGWGLRRPAGRILAALGLPAASLLNRLVLPNDYFVIHLFITLGALCVAASAFTGAPTPAHLTRKVGTWGLGAGAAVALLGAALSPSARASSALASSTASVISPWVAAARQRLLPDKSNRADAHEENPWFVSRADAPAVPPSGPPLLGPRPLVVMITVDALRADVVQSTEYDEMLPTLAALRERAVWFANTRAPGTLTKLSVSSLMMGTYFSQQYWVDTGRYHTIAEDQTQRFPELLKQAGVLTINYRSIGWLRNGNVLGGFREDVHVKDPSGKNYYTPTAPLFAKLLPRLSKLGDEPAFVYSHLSDPHAPYTLGKVKGSEFDRYLAEVALVDKHLGRLVRHLEKHDLSRRTLLIISADHGEAFGEHGSRTHGTTLYDETLRVPLLMVLPNAAPRRIDEPVTWLDLGPTVLDFFGLDTPGHMMGESLVPFLRGETPTLTRPIVAETRLMQAWLTRDNKKLILDTRTGRKELYDLERDPGELNNLADDEAALSGPLHDLQRFMDVHTLRKDGYRPPYVR